MGRYKKSTIKEVAALAGVSTTTVSYFVSGREDVCSLVTAERIRKAVAELHYTPSSLVVGMQKSTQRGVGALISSPWDLDIGSANFFYESIWKGIYEEADEIDYSILRYSASVRSSNKAETFLDGRVDGLLYHAHFVDNERPEKIAKAGLPIVLITRSLNLPEGCGAVYSDGATVMKTALDRLWALGHRRIAHSPGQLDIDDIGVERLRGYEKWMQEHDAFDPELILESSKWHGANMEAPFKKLRDIPNPPTAVVCGNDDIAVRLINVARAAGIDTPGDLSVVGIDNSNAPHIIAYNLTSIDPRIDLVGRESLRCVLSIINGELPENNRKAIRHADWVNRGTVAPPRL